MPVPCCQNQNVIFLLHPGYECGRAGRAQYLIHNFIAYSLVNLKFYQNIHDLLFQCIDKVIITESSNADKEALEQDHHGRRNEWLLESE